MNHLVTVAVPTFNNPVGLRKVLENMTHQTYTNLEIIISDNCSPGTETQDVILEFAKKDQRIQHYRQDRNIGVVYNYQFLKYKGSGEYFLFVQDDDDWSPTFIENLVKYLDKHPTLDVAICPTRYMNSETGELSEVHTLKNLTPFNTVGNGEMGFVVMGLWRRKSYIALEAPYHKLIVGGLDHATTAHALLCGGVGVIDTDWYLKGFKPRRFTVTYAGTKEDGSEMFTFDIFATYKAWYQFVKMLVQSPYIPKYRKLLIPAIATTNLFRASVITAINIVIELPDNPVKRLVQRRFFGAN